MTEEGEMVCAVCNGKGYVVEKNKEAACSECQGRGEYLLFDNAQLPGLEARQYGEAQPSGNLSR
jgi:RecJ-like exonuclease